MSEDWDKNWPTVVEQIRNEDGDEVLWTIVLKVSATWVSFKLYEAVSWDDDGELYEQDIEEPGPSRHVRLAEASPLFWGNVKWDGCSEASWNEAQRHVCDGAESYRRRFDAVQWTLAAAHEAMVNLGTVPEWEPCDS